MQDHNSTQSSITGSAHLSKVINAFITGEEAAMAKAAVRQQAGGNQFFNRQDVIRALTSLQLEFRPEYNPGQKVHVNTDEFKSCLLSSMARMNNVAVPKTMNQIDGRTIDFVEMIFGAFLRDENISDIVKTLLLSMQVPIIKTSLLDQKFFFDIKHPARNLLNTIAKIGIGIEDKENAVYQTMTFIVEQLLRSFDKNFISFSTAQAALNRLASIEESKNSVTEKQTRKMILQEHARQLVLTELQYHSMKTRLPKSVQPLILNHWSTLMFHCYLKHGRDGTEWKDVSGALQLLVRSFQPVVTQENWLALKNMQKGIVNIVSARLGETHQNKEKVFIAIRNLERYYTKVLDESEFNDSSYEAEDFNFDAIFLSLSKGEIDDQTGNPVDQQIGLSQAQLANLPEEVKPNTWFEVFTGADHSVRRLKLSVIVKEKAQLIFVDREGIEVLTKDAEIFSGELKNKQSRLIEDCSIFDRALASVIKEISKHARE